MKSKLKSTLYFLAVLSILTTTINFVAHAESKKLSATESAYLTSSCTPIINKLNQLHVSDALMRVNRGQLYETILNKIMVSFDRRLQNNSLDASAISQITSSFSTQLDTFRKDYISYEEQISNTIKVGCTNDAQAFVDNLDKSRQLRIKVYSDVQNLNLYIDNYSSAFTVIKSNILGQGVN
jgi:hypothetical protein